MAMRALVQRVAFRGIGLPFATELDSRCEADRGDGELAVRVLAEGAGGGVAIALDDETALGRDREEGEHMARGHRRDQQFLGIGERRVTEEVRRARVAQGLASREVHDVRAAEAFVREWMTIARPVELDAVFRHGIPSRLSAASVANRTPARHALPMSSSPGHRERPRRVGIARVLSKAGLCSRSEAERRVRAGRVRINGLLVEDPEYPVDPDRDRVSVDDQPIEARARVCVALNKPRGLVTTTSDERGRDTVYRCFDGAALPWLAPVGRLDRASEGLLLFSNDPAWAARLTDPATGPDKTYHVQIDAIPDAATLGRLVGGEVVDGERLAAKSVALLRAGERNAWLEIVLDEGRNRHIRRLLAAHGLEVLRLVRVAIGELRLGDLAKGQWRELGADEIAALAPHPRRRAPPPQPAGTARSARRR